MTISDRVRGLPDGRKQSHSLSNLTGPPCAWIHRSSRRNCSAVEDSTKSQNSRNLGTPDTTRLEERLFRFLEAFSLPLETIDWC